MRPVARNTDFGVPDQVRHKPSCPATGNGKVPGIYKIEGLKSSRRLYMAVSSGTICFPNILVC